MAKSKQKRSIIRRLFSPLFTRLRERFRRQRYQSIADSTSVEALPGFKLDLGGGPASFFAARYPRPAEVILVDVDESITIDPAGILPDVERRNNVWLLREDE